MGCSECRHSTATQSPLMGSGWDCTSGCNDLRICTPERMCVCISLGLHASWRPLYGRGLQHPVVVIKSSPVVKSSIPLYLFGLQDNLIITHACTRCLTCLDFQTSRTGIPAMIELGSSWAAEFTVSLAPITRTRSVSDWTHHRLTLENISQSFLPHVFLGLFVPAFNSICKCNVYI